MSKLHSLKLYSNRLFILLFKSNTSISMKFIQIYYTIKIVLSILIYK